VTSTATSPDTATGTGTVRTGTDWTPRLWGALILLCGVLFLDGLDVSMVGVALPSIRSQLGMSTSGLQWVVSGYVLGYGGFLLLGGRAADLLGRRRVLLIALGVFAVASLFGGLVDNATLLILSRFIKGVAAAFTAPAGLSIITTTFPEGPARNRALSIYTACGASGFSSGLVLGGLMTEVGWRWNFLLPVPIALAVLLVGIRLIPDSPRPDLDHRGYDAVGAVISTAALLLLVFTVVSAPRAGWGSARTLGSFALVAVLVTAFVLIERRVAHPLLRLGILRNRSVIAADVAAMVMFGSYIGFQFIGTMYMQSLLGWRPLSMALAFLPAGLIVAFGGPRAGGLVNRFGAARVVIAGLSSLTAGYLLFLRIGAQPNYPLTILPSMLLLGLGFALAFPALNIQATSGVADDEQGLASGLVQTAFQVGGAITLAVVTVVISANTHGTSTAQVLAGYHPALVLVVGVALAGVLATVALGGLRARHNASNNG
jgi:EmrB/QacA subfamily drug resistance transporter